MDMDTPKITSIWFESDNWADPYDSFDCNMDVVFTLDDNTKWVATFVTYNNIETLRRKNNTTGECLKGRYFCATDMILVESADQEVIRLVIEDMVSQGNHNLYCSSITEDGG